MSVVLIGIGIAVFAVLLAGADWRNVNFRGSMEGVQGEALMGGGS